MGLEDRLPDAIEGYKNLGWPELEIVSREEWGALPPTSVEEFTNYPIKNVILGYTETEKCEDKESCIKLMQELQKKHMAEGHSDIRFSYVVGWDMRVYAGRGFNVIPGTHPRYPELKGKSVEVVLTDQRGDLPDGFKSSIMYILIDKYSFDDWPISYEDKKFHLDYDDPPKEFEEIMEKERVETNEKSQRILAPYVKDFKEHLGIVR